MSVPVAVICKITTIILIIPRLIVSVLIILMLIILVITILILIILILRIIITILEPPWLEASRTVRTARARIDKDCWWPHLLVGGMHNVGALNSQSRVPLKGS